MFRHSSLGWGLTRPSTLAARVKQGASGQGYSDLGLPRSLHNHQARVRLQHSNRWSWPSQGSTTEPESLSKPMAAPAAEAFFGGQHELECLTGLLSTQPHAITVIVGPVSSGKTALVQQYIQQLEANSLAQPIYIDCQKADVQTPDYFAETLLRITSSSTKRLPAFAGAFLTAVAKALSHKFKLHDSDIITDLQALPMSEVTAAFSAMTGTSALSRVLELFQQGLDGSAKQVLSAQRPKQWPALIIDEANVLTSWSSTHPRELNTLLRFFVRVSKQQNTAHVLLVTSDYAFIDWLAQGVKRIFYRAQVIGDFRTSEARQFYEILIGRASQDDDWRQVYEVCGGNAGLLKSAALDSSRMSLAEALQDIMGTVRRSINLGLKPKDKDGWTQAQYATAVRSLLAAPEKAVSADVLEAAFGGGAAGDMVLQAMVRADLLAYRPSSSWARDIPSSAFGKDMVVITAPTPADLACMRQLELPEPAPSAGTEEKESSSSVELQDTNRQLDKVQQSIDEYAAETKELKADKPEGWQEDVRQLRKIKEQLRENKEQLREEKLLLMGSVAG